MTDDGMRERKHFAMNIERTIRVANNEIINPIVGQLSTDGVVAVAVEVAKRRAAYIDATYKLGQTGAPRASGDDLRALRLEYEEAREAFGALMVTIERGYIDLPMD